MSEVVNQRVLLFAISAMAIVLVAAMPWSVAEGARHAQLPSPRVGTASAWVDGAAYVLGGVGGPSATLLDDVVRFDPDNGVARTLHASLPGGATWGASVAAGGSVYQFGGCTTTPDNEPCLTDRILRFDPITKHVAVMSARLPEPRTVDAAVSDGAVVYLFGGSGVKQGVFPDGQSYTLQVPLTEILRYDPSADQVTVMNATLPARTDGSSAVWLGGAAYILGGSHYHGIVRYDPATDAVATLNATVPLSLWEATSFSDGCAIFTAGGIGPSRVSDEVLRYVPGGPAPEVWGHLPESLYGASSVWSGARGYVFGGYGGPVYNETYFADITPIDVPVLPPTGLTARPSNTLGAPLTAPTDAVGIALSWQVPADGCPVTSYRVYRGTEPGQETFLAEVGGNATTFLDHWLPDVAWLGTGAYVYRVTAVEARGETGPTNEASCRPVYAILPQVGTC